jgi:hypothetical protein
MHSRHRPCILPAVVFLLATAARVPAQAPAQPPADTAGLPLAPARWSRFTADRGTWISLDVSPDGRTIVFDLLGDLYALPIAGGAATRLTSGLAHDMQPPTRRQGELAVSGRAAARSSGALVRSGRPRSPGTTISTSPRSGRPTVSTSR